MPVCGMERKISIVISFLFELISAKLDIQSSVDRKVLDRQ